jgi:3',5'-cyclic AMP phosphodiesterase CpdA
MTFTLAHLSDPHLGPMPNPRLTQLFGKRLTGYINWQRKRRFVHDPAVLAKITTDMLAQTPDHIAVTGDLANIGLPEEFPPGRDWLQRLGSVDDVSFVLGNHDVYKNEAITYAARLWGAYMTDDDGSAGFPYVRRRGPVALIGVSSGVPTAPFLATGLVGPRQLNALAAILHELRGENLFRVIMIHHPPVSVAPGHKLLLDAKSLLKVIAEFGAELVIHGHDHIQMLAWLAGPNGSKVPSVGVPSASATFGAGHAAAAYHLYEIDGAPGAWNCELISRGLAPDGNIVEQRRIKLGQ